MKQLLYITTVILNCFCYAQTLPKVNAPDFETKQVGTTNYYFNSSLNSTGQNFPSYATFPSTPMGATADDIMRQANTPRNGPYYPPGATPQQIQQANIAYAQQQMANDPAYQMPNANNGFTNPALKREKELMSILNEANSAENGKRKEFEHYKSPEFAKQSKPYWDALSTLKSMASGKTPASLKDAFYKMESAYGNAYLSYKEYSDVIKENADFMQRMMAQNGYDRNNNEAIHKTIQKFFKDTNTITINAPDMPKPIVKKHIPYTYDYIDYKGEKDHRNYFVTKALATGSGQCNGLPIMYAISAESLGAKVYLSLAPNHSFNKYPDNAGKIHNYEPTSNWNISNDWYSEHMFITPQAEKSGIYLDTMNKIMILGDCIAQLGYGYLTKYGVADGTFLNECINASMACFPKNNNLMALLLKSSTIAHMLDRLLYENGVKDLKDIDKVSGAKELYEALKQNEAYLKSLGYVETPETLYEEQMKLQEFRGKDQAAKGISGKEKRNLFIKIN